MASASDNNTNNCTNGDVQTPENWQEISIPVPWGHVAAKWWGPKNKQPIIAIHGWQDNAGTFDRLCPLLPADIPILCIDLPGHGKSSHYPPGLQYFVFWDGISLIRRIVKEYKWTNITLMGHSLGGALSFMYAACFPDEVKKFISIDIAGPTVRNHDKTAEATGKCIDKFLEYECLPESKLPCYEYNEMVDTALDAYNGSLSRSSVQILMIRGMTPFHNGDKPGYHYVRDLRLKVSLLGMFSLEQVLSYARRIKCEMLNIRAVPGMQFEHPELYTKVVDTIRESARRVDFHQINGTHHLHLNTPEVISDIIANFLTT